MIALTLLLIVASAVAIIHSADPTVTAVVPYLVWIAGWVMLLLILFPL